ncbi:metallophosphoesterase family protein [Cohnella caldifontis]|uniref:metallophosphoesterase family protein n=1 Tax=Cohnella caldifontis TaxID=3027471 RepID=UPI0023ED4978|nr:metallophosphoesterase family protein [Cohnella sp. YIM B05605]
MGDELKFRPDGTFKIVQFTDLHFGEIHPGSQEAEERTTELMERIIAAEKPDLVALTGDLHWSIDVPDPKAALRRAIAPVVRSGVAWAAVFGNHDAEEGVTKEELLAIQQEDERCLTAAGPDDIHGIGNYALTVKKQDGTDGAALYFFDSGDYAPTPIGGYAWIHPDQVRWYVEQSRGHALRDEGPLPAIAFFHIPFPEYKEAWNGEQVTGVNGESVCCPGINSGLFGAMVQMGDVMGTFVGHDHDNDYCGTLHGIRLCYGRVTGYNTYGKLPRGARVIELREGRRAFETWIVQEDGSIVR